MAIILLAYEPCVVIFNCWDRFCTLGRALHTKETLPDFREWCRVTRHPRVFRELTGCQRDLRFWGVTLAAASTCLPQQVSSSIDALFLACWGKHTLVVTSCETPRKSNFLKKCNMVISVKIHNFSRSWMTKRALPLESSREI